MTQERLAENLGILQATVSKIEHQSDMYVSTLARLVEAMGDALEINACFPEASVRLKPFSEPDPKHTTVNQLSSRVVSGSNTAPPRPPCALAVPAPSIIDEFLRRQNS